MPSGQRQTHGWLGRKRTAAVAFGVLALAIWGFFGELMRNRSMQSEMEDLNARVVVLETDVSATARKAEMVAGDQAAEREARTKFGLMRPGEQVVVIKGKAPLVVAEPAPTPVVEKLPNWQKWWNYLFKR